MPNCDFCSQLGPKARINRAQRLMLWRYGYTYTFLTKRGYEEAKHEYANQRCISLPFIKNYLGLSKKEGGGTSLPPPIIVTDSSPEEDIVDSVDEEDLHNLTAEEAEPDPVTKEPQFRWFVRGSRKCVFQGKPHEKDAWILQNTTQDDVYSLEDPDSGPEEDPFSPDAFLWGPSLVLRRNLLTGLMTPLYQGVVPRNLFKR